MPTRDRNRKHRNTSRDRDKNRREINTKQIQRGRERELRRNSFKDKQSPERQGVQNTEENITIYRKKDINTEDIETEEDLQTRVTKELETKV